MLASAEMKTGSDGSDTVHPLVGLLVGKNCAMLQQLNEPKAEQISKEALVSLSEEALLQMLQQVCTAAPESRGDADEKLTSALFLRLEKVFHFSKEDFMPKNAPQPGAWPGASTVSKCPQKRPNLACPSDPVQISGEQRLKVAQERAQKNQAALQKDLESRRAGGAAQIKREPDGEDEPMDASSSIPNGSVNGHPGAASPSLGHANSNGGGRTEAASQELQDFVFKTFRKHFVVTLNEFKRLLNLHLASMPAGQSLFHSVSDHMLTDAIVLSHCKQIMVPVSIQGGGRPRASSGSRVAPHTHTHMRTTAALRRKTW